MSEWNPKANELFSKAIDIESAEQREAFLDEACGSDQDLRKCVERLLNAHLIAATIPAVSEFTPD